MNTLTDKAMASFDALMASHGHRPSDDQKEGLRAIPQCVDKMIDGTLENSFYLSSLDTGIGKSIITAQTIRAILEAPERYGDTGIIICLSRKDEIWTFIGEIGALPDQYAVMVQMVKDNEDLLNTGRKGDRNRAQVLLTTQKMVSTRTSEMGRLFKDTPEFFFNNEPRAVRLWDESVTESAVTSVRIGQLKALSDIVGQTRNQRLMDLHETCEGIINSTENRGFAPLPALSGIMTTGQYAEIFRYEDQWLRDIARSMAYMFGKSVFVRSDGKSTAIDYHRQLPPDMTPMLVLDASARLKHTYVMQERTNRNIVALKSAVKDYSNRTVHIMARGGGKDSWLKHQHVLVAEIVAVIKSKPRESWLVVHHLFHPRKFPVNVPTLVRKALGGDWCDWDVNFVHWGGGTDATNIYGNIGNTILAGTYFLPDSTYEGMGRAACGLQPGEQLSKFDLDETRRKHLASETLQGGSRDRSRFSINGGCPPCDLYVIASPRSGVPLMLRDGTIFPGAQCVDWLPAARKPLTGKVLAAMGSIVADPRDAVPFADVRRAVGLSKSNFRVKVCYHSTFLAELEERGITIKKARAGNTFTKSSVLWHTSGE